MKKQKNDILTLCKAGLLIFIFSGMWSASLLAQTVKQTYVNRDATHYYDIEIPSGVEYLYLEVKGADGGKANLANTKGGEGAWASGYVAIGDGSGEIPAGSTLRLIPGQAGLTSKYCSGGGGGSGVAFQAPNTKDWKLLLVAGGGGGAGGWKNGKAATAYTYGLAGNNHQGDNLKNGGTGGNGGKHEGPKAYPGGGAFSAGGGGCPGQAGMLNNIPVGGMGGKTDCVAERVMVAGGFGFGGGGSGVVATQYPAEKYQLETGGGGGGGYSGGGGGWAASYTAGGDASFWAGMTEDRTHGGGAGGGGGSYASSDWVVGQSFRSFNISNDPQHGHISYRYLNSSSIRLVKAETKCIDLTNGNTARGTNIQLVQCKGNPAQQWIMNGTTIRLAENVNKCIDLSSSNTANGANIQLWDCNDTDAQTWIYDAINRTFRSRIDPHKCLDLVNGNTTGGTNIQLYNCVYTNNQPNQQWVVDNIETAPVNGTNLRIHLVKNRDKALDVFAGHTANGTNIQLWRTQETNNSQYFTFEGGQIKMQAHPDKCLDLDQANTANGTNIKLWDCKGNDAQLWIYDGSTRAFRSALDLNKCLDVTNGNTGDGTNIKLWDCNNTNAQQFEIY